MPDQPLREYPDTVSAALDLLDSDPALDRQADDDDDVDDDELENLSFFVTGNFLSGLSRNGVKHLCVFNHDMR